MQIYEIDFSRSQLFCWKNIEWYWITDPPVIVDWVLCMWFVWCWSFSLDDMLLSETIPWWHFNLAIVITTKLLKTFPRTNKVKWCLFPPGDHLPLLIQQSSPGQPSSPSPTSWSLTEKSKNFFNWAAKYLCVELCNIWQFIETFY